MHIARQAPQFTLKPGPGLAVIEDLRQLRDWYQRLSEHRRILAEAAHRQNNLYVVSTATGSGVKNVVAHQGTRYNVKPGEAGDDFSDYELAPSDLFVRQPGTTAANTSSSLYNTPGTPPATDPPERTPYTLPRPKGLVRRRELKAFILWATRSTDPTPAPTGLATRDDLRATAQQLAAAE